MDVLFRKWPGPTYCGALVMILVFFPISSGAGDIPREDFQRLGTTQESFSPVVLSESGESGSIGACGPGGFLYLYRKIFSEMDSRDCPFHPSCSRYAEKAFREHGPFRGALMASSRLQRCHPRAYYYCPLDVERSRLHDPVPPRYRSRPSLVFKRPPRKSAAFAQTLSAVLPGSGQVYAGRPWDGFYAAIQVGLPAAFSVLNYSRDGASSLRGGLQGALAIGFYLGNIYGAGDAARKYPPNGRFMFNPVNVPPLAAEVRNRSTEIYGVALEDLRWGNHAEAWRRFLLLHEHGQEDYRNKAIFFAAIVAAEEGRWDDSAVMLDRFHGGCTDVADKERIIDTRKFLQLRHAQREQDARRARRFSTVLPGSGQARAGAYGEALTALGVNSIFGYYAYCTIKTRSWGELVFFVLPNLWRYFRGNIQQAGNLAYMRDQEADIRALYRRLDLPASPSRH